MSIKDDSQKALFTANNQLQDFFPKHHPMAVFSREIFPRFSDKEFSECYSDKGRPAISPAFLAAVTLLQYLENLSDHEASQACICRMDWKYALHLPLMQNKSFDPSTLTYFRRRLKENKKSSLVFDKIVGLLQDNGLIKKQTKQRVDATHIIAHVNRISTTDLLFRTVLCLMEEIEKKDTDYYTQNIPEYMQKRYAEKFSSFGLSKEKRMDRMAEIVEDGLFLKQLLTDVPSDKLQEMQQLSIMETIFEENVIVKKTECSGREIIEVEEIQGPKQTIFDPRDTSLKLGVKGRKSWVGSKCHIVETAEKGEANFITDMIYQKSTENDVLVHDQIKQGNERNGIRQKKLFADTAYISAIKMKEYDEACSKLMGYVQRDGTQRHDDYKLEKFNIDMKTGVAICPQGKKSENTTVSKGGDLNIYFSSDECMNCPAFEKCVGKNRSKKKRRLHLIPGYAYIRDRRKEQKQKDFREEMSVRAQVEGTISEGVRFHGLRVSKYKGVLGHQLQFYFVGAAINVKRFIKALIQGQLQPAMGQ